MSDLSLNSVRFHATQPVQPATPAKSGADQKPANSTAGAASHGPAVVLGGAFAQASGGANGQQGSTQSQATGQHINHVF